MTSHARSQSTKYRHSEHSHPLVAGDRQTAQNELSFGQTTLNYILKVLLEHWPCTCYTWRTKLGHKRSREWSCCTWFLVNVDQRIQLLCPLGRVRLFSTVDSEGQVKVRSKCKIINSINAHKISYAVWAQESDRVFYFVMWRETHAQICIWIIVYCLFIVYCFNISPTGIPINRRSQGDKSIHIKIQDKIYMPKDIRHAKYT